MPDNATFRPAIGWQPGNTEKPGGTLSRIAFDAATQDARAAPLPWLGGDFAVQRWLVQAGSVQRGTHAGWRYARCGPVAFACRHIDDAGTGGQDLEAAAHGAYEDLFSLQDALGLAFPQRIWHWLSDATAGTGDEQRYQRFCRGRAEALDGAPAGWSALPPATLVAGARRGLTLHVLLGDTPVEPVENPRQVSAYRYPRAYGIRPPAFARAGVARLGDTRYLLISGTASIVGHATRHAGDVVAQADEALTNLEAVITASAPKIGRKRLADLECLITYLRRPDDADAVAARLRARLPAVPHALCHAPLCRDDLLVEFEAQMRLDS